MNNQPNAPVQTTLREKLKAATHDLHLSLEKTAMAQSLSNGTIKIPSYIRYLQSLSSLHDTVESKAQTFSEWESYGIRIEEHFRYPLLQADLEALGAAKHSQHPPIVFDCDNDFAALVGIMYVLEGSTMGGRFLAPRLTHLTGEDQIPATRYFQAYGEETMNRWKQFSMFLEFFGDQYPEKQERIILSAQNMFLFLEEMMRELD